MKFDKSKAVAMADKYFEAFPNFNFPYDGTVYPLYDGGVAITLTAPDDMSLALGQDIKVRLTLSGATNPDIKWAIRSQK